jgi:hypothetical protein
MIDKSLKDRVVDIKQQGDSIILVKLLFGDLVLNVISGYAPKKVSMRALRGNYGSWIRWLVV